MARQLEVAVLPALSCANARGLLKAMMPLPPLNVEQATELMITHLHQPRPSDE